MIDILSLKPVIAHAGVLALALTLTACTATKPDTNRGRPSGPPGFTRQKNSLTRQTQYALFLPAAYGQEARRRWPVILFLHGIGESGTNVWQTVQHGPAKFIAQHPDFPFILVSPQCPSGEKWSPADVLGVLDQVQARYATDPNRVYLTGLSMGGFGAWSLAVMYPERFSAVAPVCGGGESISFIACQWYHKTDALRQLPFRVFHGAKDPVVPPADSQHMVDELRNAGCTDVTLTVYPDRGHDVWNETYANPELYEWFLKHDHRAGDQAP